MVSNADRRGRADIRDERGAVVILVAVMMVVLMGFVGLAVDSGSLYNHKRWLQTAADGGALQGAYEVHRGHTSLVTTAALAGTAENGFQHGADGVTVEVYHPPVTGYYVGDVAAVEVVVRQPSPITFMTLMGWGATTIPARAVATAGGNSDSCIHILEEDDQDAFDYQSSAVLNAPNCSLIVDSDDCWGGHLTSNSYVNVAYGSFRNAYDPPSCSGYVEESNSDLDADTGSHPSAIDPLCPDPLNGICMPLPPVGACNGGNTDMEWDQPDVYLDPGTYCGTFTLKNATHAHLSPGIYVIRGGSMNIEGDSILQGPEGAPAVGAEFPDGVMFFFTEWNGNFEPFSFSFSSNAQARLTASSECSDPPLCTMNPYRGIVFYVDPGAGDGTEEFRLESNTGTHYLNGTVYMPNHVFNVESSTVVESGCYPGSPCPDGSDYLIIVVRRMIAESNSLITTRAVYPGGGASLSVLLAVRLTE